MDRNLDLTTALLNGISGMPINSELSLADIVKGIKEDGLEQFDDRNLLLEHLYQLLKEGFVEGRIKQDGFHILDVVVWRLTWKGQDLLDQLSK